MIPTQLIEFLGMETDSKTITISLPQEKVHKIILKCQNLYHSHHLVILEFTKVKDHLTSTIQAALPARIYLLSLQQQQIQALNEEESYKGNTILSRDSKQELLWWIRNLEICNGMTLINQPLQSLLLTDTSLTGSLQRKCICETWTCQERMWHINELELLLVSIRKKTFRNIFCSNVNPN